MSLTSKIRKFVNDTTEKINIKLDEIESKKLSKIAIKEEIKAQKNNTKKEIKKKREERITKRKEEIKETINTISQSFQSAIFAVKMFFSERITELKLFVYKILSKCSNKIKLIYVIKDYKKSVKEHKKLIEMLYTAANIKLLAKNHDDDLLTSESIKIAISGSEPPNHRYVNKHHIEYWLKDNKILEIPFANTLEIMCELFVAAYNKNDNTVDYDLVMELFNEKADELFISEVLVKYFRACIWHAQEKRLIAPDYEYCNKIYNEQVLF